MPCPLKGKLAELGSDWNNQKGISVSFFVCGLPWSATLFHVHTSWTTIHVSHPQGLISFGSCISWIHWSIPDPNLLAISDQWRFGSGFDQWIHNIHDPNEAKPWGWETWIVVHDVCTWKSVADHGYLQTKNHNEVPIWVFRSDPSSASMPVNEQSFSTFLFISASNDVFFHLFQLKSIHFLFSSLELQRELT